jgi:hypothetical protein
LIRIHIAVSDANAASPTPKNIELRSMLVGHVSVAHPEKITRNMIASVSIERTAVRKSPLPGFLTKKVATIKTTQRSKGHHVR